MKECDTVAELQEIRTAKKSQSGSGITGPGIKF